jgi:hypothetical protein
MFDNDTFLMVGGFVAAFLAGLFGYFKRPKEMTRVDPVLSGIGLEYGNREQSERLIVEAKRQADALVRCAEQLTILSGAFVDEKTDSINDRLDDQNKLIEHLNKTVDSLLNTRRTNRNK